MNLLKIYPHLIVIAKYRVRCNGTCGNDDIEYHIVRKYADGVLDCDCPADKYKINCFHIEVVCKHINTSPVS